MELQNILCPSYICKPGAKLYGIVNSNGFIDYLKSPIEIDETFVTEASKGRTPEARFRFSGSCAKSGCNHWNKISHQCNLIDQLIEVIAKDPTESLQDCPIRSKCRWFNQRGGLACAQCNETIRNMEVKMIESIEQSYSSP